MSEINQVTLHDGPEPWAASVEVHWNISYMGWGRRRRHRRIAKSLNGLDIADYQTRYDTVMDVTHIYFRNKDDAVSSYFYLS